MLLRMECNQQEPLSGKQLKIVEYSKLIANGAKQQVIDGRYVIREQIVVRKKDGA